ncbi:MAG: tetratricopeptide repeat protein, partial [Pseudomonadota bacterium]
MIAEAERLAEQRSLGSERADRIDRQTRIDYAGRPSEELYFRSDEIRRLISDGDARLAELHAERVLDLVGTKTVVYNVQLVRALSGMAAALRAQGQLRQALACAEQMVTVSREIAVPLLIARAQYNKGRVLRSSHRPLEALVEYEAASAQMLQQVGSQDWTLLTAATGQVLVDLERSQEAVELLETALMSMPPATPVSDALPIRVELARAMTASGNEAEALRQIERVRASGATFPPTWMSVLDEYEGQALMKLGQWDAAQSLLWSALLHQAEVSPTPGPASISMMVDIVECFTQLGWHDEARMMSVIVRSQSDQVANTKPEPSDGGVVVDRLLDRMDQILQGVAG